MGTIIVIVSLGGQHFERLSVEVLENVGLLHSSNAFPDAAHKEHDATHKHAQHHVAPSPVAGQTVCSRIPTGRLNDSQLRVF